MPLDLIKVSNEEWNSSLTWNCTFSHQRFQSLLPQQYLLLILTASNLTLQLFLLLQLLSTSFSSFNCSSGNTASNLDLLLSKITQAIFLKKVNYKNDESTFSTLPFANDLPNQEKGKLIKNVLVPKYNCVFPITKRCVCYYWLEQYSWFAYPPIRYGAYYLFCVLFCNKAVTRKKELVHLHYSDWRNAQVHFKWHVNVISGMYLFVGVYVKKMHFCSLHVCICVVVLVSFFNSLLFF